MNAKILTLVCLVTAAFASARAQSPVPVIVPAATAVTRPATPGQSANDAGSTAALLQMLQEMKAANEETLRKQAATLEALDELQKLADQLRIFAKRS